jgi:hypothetical protein
VQVNRVALELSGIDNIQFGGVLHGDDVSLIEMQVEVISFGLKGLVDSDSVVETGVHWVKHVTPYAHGEVE